MHGLFSLQIDIDALNPKSSLILYCQGSAVSKSCWHCHWWEFVSCLGCFFYTIASACLPLNPLVYWLFNVCATHLPSICCLLPVISIVWALLALLLTRICIPFGIFLLHHQTSACIRETLAELYRLYNPASFVTINSRFYYLNRFRVALIWARLHHCLRQPFCKTCKLVKAVWMCPDRKSFHWGCCIGIILFRNPRFCWKPRISK